MRFIVLMTIVAPLVAGCEHASIGDYPDQGKKLPSRRTSEPGEEEAPGSSTTEEDPTTPASTFALTVTLAGTGAGTVSSTPAGLSCDGKTCKGSFPSGTKVTLQPTPESGSFFVGWGGQCTGDKPDACAPVMDGDVSISADLESIAGTWKGTYANTRDAHGCTFNNAGDVTVVMTENGASFSSSAQMTGLELRFIPSCELSKSTTGSAPATNVTLAGDKMNGTWTFSVQGANGTLAFPFTATIDGKTMTGTWNCEGCKGGGFTITKQ